MPTSPPATLDGLPGHGYAVVESLPSLGKGRSCTGVFTTGAEHRAALEARIAGREPVPWSGVVHSRHRSAEATLEVEVIRVVEATTGEATGTVTVEFGASDVPYDVGG